MTRNSIGSFSDKYKYIWNFNRLFDLLKPGISNTTFLSEINWRCLCFTLTCFSLRRYSASKKEVAKKLNTKNTFKKFISSVFRVWETFPRSCNCLLASRDCLKRICFIFCLKKWTHALNIKSRELYWLTPGFEGYSLQYHCVKMKLIFHHLHVLCLKTFTADSYQNR